MSKKLLSPEALRDFLVRRFNNQHQNWLSGEGTWPLVVALGVPTDKDIAEDASAVRAWADAWQSRTGPGDVLFEERQFSRFGRHRLPSRLSFESAEVVAAAVGQSRRWEIASERYQRMSSRWPVLVQGNALASRFNVLADYSAEDFDRLVTLLEWLNANPASNLYLRQLPVEGLDTKWLEKRTGLVAGLLRVIWGTGDEGGDFHTLVGLKKPAHRVRIRLLCPTLRSLVGGLGDIEAPVGELGRLPISPVTVVIVENLETGLALPDLENTVLVMGLGNAVSALGALPWLRRAEVLYWGDIDTHGFAILDRARRTVPQIQSVLMDEATLLAHQLLWVQEPVPCSNVFFEGLTAEETSVYDNLKVGTWGVRIRLEQERLDWTTSLQTLMDVLNSDPIPENSTDEK
ncbi:hypothetical protein PPN31114_01702 [Pandoraea pneumonica]|uniref:DUF3322 and DUF2220 domain-containing protein n=1 Tax=Pandoraea pneumonica TaxID=2508299 RepID=A0A5E4TYM0_9BURK|nr:DUF3322 and DUF2220 domain-containing protein [Pandoraea pneumonica]VVD91838.1 hypothetical protein PPN31114_01702 [Pandoraea pneumonica]